MLSNNIHHIDTLLYNNIFGNKKGTFIDITDDSSNSISYIFQKKLQWNGYLITDSAVDRNSNIVLGNNINYGSILRLLNSASVDLCIIDDCDKLHLLDQILITPIKPKVLVVKYDVFRYQSILKKLTNSYDVLYTVSDQYLICKRRVSILLNTRCTRPQNLSLIKTSIEQTFKDSGIDYHWFIIVQGKKVSIDLYNKYKSVVSNNPNITYMYTQGTGHYLFSGQFLNTALSDVRGMHCQYSYILDDDNIIHYNFIKAIKTHLLNNCQCVVVNLQNSVYDIDSTIGVDCRGIIDNANFVIRRDVLYSIGGYQLTPHFVRVGWAQDALTFKRLVQVNTKIVYTRQIGGYHNGIDYVLRKK